MSQHRPLRVAIVGCGIISENHVRAYAQHADRARVVVCCDVDRGRAEQRAHQAGEGVRIVTSFDDVLRDDGVDAVEICTPHHLHADAVVEAARAGKHILCQKPLGKTLAECDVMIAAVRDANVVLFYGETNHTAPAVVLAKETIDAGRIGTLIGIQATHAHWQGGKYLATAWRYDPAITGGGQLLDGGIHQIDVMLTLGGPVAAVSCFTHRFRPELGGEDTAVVNLRYVAGHLGTLFASQASALWPPTPGVVVYGTEAVLTLGGSQAALTLHRPDLPDRREVLLERGGDSFAAMIGRYLDTVIDGKPNPSPPEVGRENLRVVLAAYESDRLKREVRLDAVGST